MPQSSVLGPLLNLVFDTILRTQDLGSHIVYYADNTLIIVVDEDLDIVFEVAHLLERVFIRSLGLELSPAKTEAVYFVWRVRDVPTLYRGL